MEKTGIKKGVSFDQMFGTSVSSFRFIIERDSENHGLKLVREIDKFKKRYADCDPDFTTKNFEKPTYEMRYNIEYEVDLVPIIGKGVTLADCAKYIKDRGYLFAGPALLPIIKEKKRGLPNEKWLISLDVEGKAFKDKDGSMFACMRLVRKVPEITLAYYKCNVNPEFILVCLKEVKEEK